MGCRGSKSAADKYSDMPVQERSAYDQDMRLHLLAHSTPHKVELTLRAATIFVARARLAQKTVQQRKEAQGCGSASAWTDVSPAKGPSAVEAEAEVCNLRREPSSLCCVWLKLIQWPSIPCLHRRGPRSIRLT